MSVDRSQHRGFAPASMISSGDVYGAKYVAFFVSLTSYSDKHDIIPDWIIPEAGYDVDVQSREFHKKAIDKFVEAGYLEWVSSSELRIIKGVR